MSAARRFRRIRQKTTNTRHFPWQFCGRSAPFLFFYVKNVDSIGTLMIYKTSYRKYVIIMRCVVSAEGESHEGVSQDLMDAIRFENFIFPCTD